MVLVSSRCSYCTFVDACIKSTDPTDLGGTHHEVRKIAKSPRESKTKITLPLLCSTEEFGRNILLGSITCLLSSTPIPEDLSCSCGTTFWSGNSRYAISNPIFQFCVCCTNKPPSVGLRITTLWRPRGSRSL